MAQGDSTSGATNGYEFGVGNLYIRPPSGEVWLITYLNATVGSTLQISLYDQTTGRMYDAGYILDNPEIKIFLHNYFYIVVSFFSGTQDEQVVWSGVVFKG